METPMVTRRFRDVRMTLAFVEDGKSTEIAVNVPEMTLEAGAPESATRKAFSGVVEIVIDQLFRPHSTAIPPRLR